METGAFSPLYVKSSATAQGTVASSTTVTATNSSATASAQFGGTSEPKQIQIANTTSAWAYVNLGNLSYGAVTPATVANSYPVAPGAVVVITSDTEVTGASVILGSAPTGSATVIFTRGEGV